MSDPRLYSVQYSAGYEAGTASRTPPSEITDESPAFFDGYRAGWSNCHDTHTGQTRRNVVPLAEFPWQHTVATPGIDYPAIDSGADGSWWPDGTPLEARMTREEARELWQS